MAEPFTPETWKAEIADWWKQAARDLPGTMQRLGVRTAYSLLAASAFAPLVAAYSADPGKAAAALLGIAGGVGPSVAIGDLVVPELVVDGPSGREYRPTPLGDTPPRGRLVTSDQFGYDPDTLARFIAAGVVALDMETASVAAVCEAQGCPWSAFRAISDRGDDDTVDPNVLAIAGSDGTPNVPALLRYLLRRPWRIARLAKLGRDSKVAAERAAAAALRAVAGTAWHTRRAPGAGPIAR